MNDPDKPNILLIMSDQHAARACGYAGDPHVKSPCIDRLAKEGTVFTNAYCNSPSCAPSRASFFTGMYASDCDSFCNATPWAGGHPTWGSVLGQSGYHCAGTGKFDLHSDYPTGFSGERQVHGHVHSPDLTSLFRCPGIYRWNERPNFYGKDLPGSQEQEETEVVRDFLRNTGPAMDRPWAYYLGYNRPHPPFTALARFFDEEMAEEDELPEIPDEVIRGMHPVYENLRHFKRIATPFSSDEIRRSRAGYRACIREMDADIGRVLEALESSGQTDNTIVIYASDHGECLGENGLWGKGSLYDSATRVPLIVRGPGIPRGKKIDHPVSLIDLTPTLIDLAAAESPAALRGQSLRPLWSDDGGGTRRVLAENHTEGNVTGNYMIREGDWKLIHFAHYDDGLLFNLRDDPAEHVNRYADSDCVGIRDRLLESLCEHFDPVAVSDRAFAAQAKAREALLEPLSEDELAQALTSRLGAGQARALAHRMRRGNRG